MNPRLLLITLVIPIFTQAQVSLPWLKTIDPGAVKNTISSIQNDASVIVSDGLTYDVSTLFIDKQRAIFKRIYTDRTIVQGIEGKYVWSYEGNVQTEQPSFIGGIILGHQFHSQMLFFDQLHPIYSVEENVNFNGKQCHALTSREESSTFKLYYDNAGLPLGMTITSTNSDISFIYDDWKVIDGVSLPHSILIDDGNRNFTYTFSSIHFNKGTLDKFRCSFEQLTEEQKLLRLHREIMDGHYFENMEVANRATADSLVIVSAGEVYHISGIQSNETLNKRMTGRDHVRYDDLIRPIIRISEDGTLGWVIVQVQAEGVRYDASGAVNGPLEFTSAWIELYEKVDGEWKMTGNVSNFQPGLK